MSSTITISSHHPDARGDRGGAPSVVWRSMMPARRRPGAVAAAGAGARRPLRDGSRGRRPRRSSLAIVEERQATPLLAGTFLEEGHQYDRRPPGRPRLPGDLCNFSLTRAFSCPVAAGAGTDPRRTQEAVDSNDTLIAPFRALGARAPWRVRGPGAMRAGRRGSHRLLVLGRYRLLERLGAGRLRRGLARPRRAAAPRGRRQARSRSPAGGDSERATREALAAARLGPPRDRRPVRGLRRGRRLLPDLRARPRRDARRADRRGRAQRRGDPRDRPRARRRASARPRARRDPPRHQAPERARPRRPRPPSPPRSPEPAQLRRQAHRLRRRAASPARRPSRAPATCSARSPTWLPSRARAARSARRPTCTRSRSSSTRRSAASTPCAGPPPPPPRGGSAATVEPLERRRRDLPARAHAGARRALDAASPRERGDARRSCARRISHALRPRPAAASGRAQRQRERAANSARRRPAQAGPDGPARSQLQPGRTPLAPAEGPPLARAPSPPASRPRRAAGSRLAAARLARRRRSRRASGRSPPAAPASRWSRSARAARRRAARSSPRRRAGWLAARSRPCSASPASPAPSRRSPGRPPAGARARCSARSATGGCSSPSPLAGPPAPVARARPRRSPRPRGGWEGVTSDSERRRPRDRPAAEHRRAARRRAVGAAAALLPLIVRGRSAALDVARRDRSGPARLRPSRRCWTAASPSPHRHGRPAGVGTRPARRHPGGRPRAVLAVAARALRGPGEPER